MEIKHLQPQPTLTIRATVEPDKFSASLMEILPEVWGFAQKQGVQPVGPPFTLYHTYSTKEVDMEGGIPVAVETAGAGRIQPGMLAGGTVATTLHVGPYETLGESYTALEKWIQQQGLEAAGPCWEVYLTDPAEVADPAEWKTEIFWPVRETAKVDER